MASILDYAKVLCLEVSLKEGGGGPADHVMISEALLSVIKHLEERDSNEDR